MTGSGAAATPSKTCRRSRRSMPRAGRPGSCGATRRSRRPRRSVRLPPRPSRSAPAAEARMLGLAFPARDEPFRLLCLGAHADDIEIGCGGTILRLVAERPALSVRWVVFSGYEKRRGEAEAGARFFLAGVRDAAVDVHGFRDGFFPSEQARIKEAFERIKAEYQPSLVLTHFRDDLHQDHRVVSELTYNTFRDHLVWEYEIPK